MADREAVEAWTRIIRDLVLVLLGGVAILHETLTETAPDPVIVGAGLLCLGLPTAIRLKRGAVIAEP